MIQQDYGELVWQPTFSSQRAWVGCGKCQGALVAGKIKQGLRDIMMPTYLIF